MARHACVKYVVDFDYCRYWSILVNNSGSAYSMHGRPTMLDAQVMVRCASWSLMYIALAFGRLAALREYSPKDRLYSGSYWLNNSNTASWIWVSSMDGCCQLWAADGELSCVVIGYNMSFWCQLRSMLVILLSSCGSA